MISCNAILDPSLNRPTRPRLDAALSIHETWAANNRTRPIPLFAPDQMGLPDSRKKEKPVQNMQTFDGQLETHEYLCMTYRPLARKIEPQARAATI